MAKKQVLFLCTGNSCRSQLAEAVVNFKLGEIWEAKSAGTKPTGYIHPKTLQVLSEIGIDHQGWSKSVDVYRDLPFDLVVTVCDSAAEECPLWLGLGKKVHLGFSDPSKVAGTDGEMMAAFRKIRDEIAEKIPVLLESFEFSP